VITKFGFVQGLRSRKLTVDIRHGGRILCKRIVRGTLSSTVQRMSTDLDKCVGFGLMEEDGIHGNSPLHTLSKVNERSPCHTNGGVPQQRVASPDVHKVQVDEWHARNIDGGKEITPVVWKFVLFAEFLELAPSAYMFPCDA
jgi:hypothetical protein